MKFKRLSFLLFIALISQGLFTSAAIASNAPETKPPVIEVIFETSAGPFTLELNPEKAPKTVANFLTYVNEGFYNNTIFHRVIPGFVIQGGGLEKGLKNKQTHSPVENESRNGLKNSRGTISMARTTNPDSATSQFFINVSDNSSLDPRGKQPGYAVFGKITDGMDVIDKIVAVPTHAVDGFNDVPKQDIVILAVKQTQFAVIEFIPGEHYIVLDEPVHTRDSSKIEVVQAFSYGCPHCYSLEPLITNWREKQVSDVDFWHFPAVWNKSMALYARAFYAAQALNITEKIHLPLFTAIVVDQKRLSNQSELADFFAHYGVDKKAFDKAFHSFATESQVKQAEARARSYHLASVPEIIINGKYRIDPMRAGGRQQMFAVVDFLVDKERALLKK